MLKTLHQRDDVRDRGGDRIHNDRHGDARVHDDDIRNVLRDGGVRDVRNHNDHHGDAHDDGDAHTQDKQFLLPIRECRESEKNYLPLPQESFH